MRVEGNQLELRNPEKNRFHSCLYLHLAQLSTVAVDSRDSKQRQPGRRRERRRIRENPKSPLRMTGGEQVAVLRLDPTRV